MDLTLGVCSTDVTFVDRIRMIVAVEGWELGYCSARDNDTRFPSGTNLLLTDDPITFAPVSQVFRAHRRGISIAAVPVPAFRHSLQMEGSVFDRIVIDTRDLDRLARDITLSAETAARLGWRRATSGHGDDRAATAQIGISPITAMMQAARRRAGVSQADVADSLGISLARYRRREVDGGKIEIDFLLRFAEVTGLSPHTLVRELDAIARRYALPEGDAAGTSDRPRQSWIAH